MALYSLANEYFNETFPFYAVCSGPKILKANENKTKNIKASHKHQNLGEIINIFSIYSFTEYA